MDPASVPEAESAVSRDGTEAPLINSWSTSVGFEGARIWARGDMNYWATDAEQTTSLAISNTDGAMIGSDDATTSDSNLFPWTRDLTTRVGLTVSATCGLIANASSRHKAWQRVWSPLTGSQEFQAVQKASDRGRQQPACENEGSAGGGGGGGGGGWTGGAYQVCIWRITFDDYGIIGEQLLGCYVTDSPYDLMPVAG